MPCCTSSVQFCTSRDHSFSNRRQPTWVTWPVSLSCKHRCQLDQCLSRYLYYLTTKLKRNRAPKPNLIRLKDMAADLGLTDGSWRRWRSTARTSSDRATSSHHHQQITNVSNVWDCTQCMVHHYLLSSTTSRSPMSAMYEIVRNAWSIIISCHQPFGSC